jgi:hypothetical protein
VITFNTLLAEAAIDPTRVKLVRHQDHRFDKSPYQLWRANDGSFGLYQRIQRRPRFLGADYVASFVATPLNETLFVGLYRVASAGIAPSGTIDPASGGDETGSHFYDLQLVNELADYRAKLLIEWGPGKRSWVQRAHQQPKQIIELRRSAGDPPFPAFLDFCERLSTLASLPLSWRQALSAVRGVYLLSCPKTGLNYVGSADGERGLWGRWEDYVASGHGGNKRMMEVPAADYQVSILEIASSAATTEELIRMENRWKQKFLTRIHGLNAN